MQDPTCSVMSKTLATEFVFRSNMSIIASSLRTSASQQCICCLRIADLVLSASAQDMDSIMQLLTECTWQTRAQLARLVG